MVYFILPCSRANSLLSHPVAIGSFLADREIAIGSLRDPAEC